MPLTRNSGTSIASIRLRSTFRSRFREILYAPYARRFARFLLLSLSLGAVAAPQPAPATQPAPTTKSAPAATTGAKPIAAAPAKSAPAKAATERCRDDKGKFIACAKKAETKHCRDAKGKFTACPK